MTPSSVVVLVVLILIAFVLIRSVRVAAEWQRAVVLRLGRFAGVRGPGLYLLFPVIDTVAAVIDMRVETTGITAEQALTHDTVSVGVDAIVFWQVEDPRAAAVTIANYRQAIERVAQTSLREAIGSTDLGRLLGDRQAADEAVRATIARKTATWGVVVRSVEIKDVVIPAGLQDAMSRQAQAERERQARVTLAGAEVEIARQVSMAAEVYAENPVALQLRQMNLLYEMNKERGATVLIPTEMAASLGATVAMQQAARVRTGGETSSPG